MAATTWRLNTAKVRHAAFDRGLSLRQLAALAGVNERNLQYWMNGEFRPHARSLKKLADAIGIPASELVINETAETPQRKAA
jgi:transcriptional regulator with XRE-family HTH domain